MDAPRWCLLIHQLPPRPLYLRAKIRQRLARVGAIPVKNSVYVLPHGEQALEDLQWIAQEATAGGGEVYVCVADFAGGITADELVARFNADRDRLYREVAAELREALGRLKRRSTRRPPEQDIESALGRLTRRVAEIREIDFFGAPGGAETAALLRSLRGRLHSPARPLPANAPRADQFAGRTWVTRRGLYVDRVASAWLIRRFVDAAATFRFIDSADRHGAPDEVRFDIVGGQFSHEGDRCTFEGLVAKLGLRDPALGPIAEIVHDVDLKDGKFNRPDTPGVQQVFDGIVAAHRGDEERLERGFAVLDDLYASFRKRTGAAPQGRAAKDRSRRSARRSRRPAARRSGGTP